MRALSGNKVLSRFTGGGLMDMGVNFVSHHDGYLLKKSPLEMIREGDFNNVPFMAGSTRDEAGMIERLSASKRHTRPKGYQKKAGKIYDLNPKQARELVELYPLEEFNNRPIEAFVRMNADSGLGCATYLGLKAASERQENVFLYRFDFDDHNLARWAGSFHSLEIPFIFGNLEDTGGLRLFDETNIGPARDLSKIVQGYWVNFARNADPNGEGLPGWPRYDPDAPMVQILDVTTETRDAGFIDDRCAFWNIHGGRR